MNKRKFNGLLLGVVLLAVFSSHYVCAEVVNIVKSGNKYTLVVDGTA